MAHVIIAKMVASMTRISSQQWQPFEHNQNGNWRNSSIHALKLNGEVHIPLQEYHELVGNRTTSLVHIELSHHQPRSLDGSTIIKYILDHASRNCKIYSCVLERGGMHDHHDHVNVSMTARARGARSRPGVSVLRGIYGNWGLPRRQG
eukprot:SAG31_NODE_858_length_11437_cov_38.887049_2_plen_148_part_00